MAINKGLRKFTVQESVAPYTRVVNPDADTEYPVCRGVVNTGSDEVTVTLTFPDSSTLAITLSAGQIEPLAVIKTNNA